MFFAIVLLPVCRVASGFVVESSPAYDFATIGLFQDAGVDNSKAERL